MSKHQVTLSSVPIIANISFNCYVSSFLGNRKFPNKCSTRMKPANQRSVHSSFLLSPNSNSGGWQHNLTSVLVYHYDILSLITFWKSGCGIFRAKPKLVSLIREWSSINALELLNLDEQIYLHAYISNHL